jgi:hypothetical protein
MKNYHQKQYGKNLNLGRKQGENQNIPKITQRASGNKFGEFEKREL